METVGVNLVKIYQTEMAAWMWTSLKAVGGTGMVRSFPKSLLGPLVIRKSDKEAM